MASLVDLFYTNVSVISPLTPLAVLLSQDNATQQAACHFGERLMVDSSFLPHTSLFENLTASEECVVGETEPYTETHPLLRNITILFNSPFVPREFSTWNVALKITVYVIAMLLATVGNLLVILTVALNKSMQNSTTVYLLNLAASDLMVVFFCMWVHLGANITADWPFSEFICKVYPFFQITAVSGSVLFLAVIAGERFFAIVYPLKRRFSKRSIHAVVIVTTWGLAILIAIPNLMTRNLQTLYWADREQRWCEEQWPRVVVGEEVDNITEALPFLRFCIYDQPGRRIYYTIQFTLMYIVPILVMTVAYSVIMCYFRNYKMPGHQTDHILEYQHKTKRRVIKMLIIVFLAFVVCWTPHVTLLLYNAYAPDQFAQIEPWVSFVALYIAYFNSALNPILYAGLNTRVRKAIKETMSCLVCRKNKVSPDETLPNGTTTHQNGLQPNGHAKSSVYTTTNGSLQGSRSPYATSNGRTTLPPIAEDELESVLPEEQAVSPQPAAGHPADTEAAPPPGH